MEMVHELIDAKIAKMRSDLDATIAAQRNSSSSTGSTDMNPKDTLGCEGPTFQVCDNCSSPNLCRVYGACPSTWPAAQIVPDPLEHQMTEMRERLDQQQREIDEIIGPDADIDNITGYNVRGLLLGAASLMLLGLMMWVAS